VSGAIRMKMMLSTIVAAGAGLALAAQAPALTAPADLLVVNGKVYTADGRGSFAQAVAVRGNTIAAVGTTQEIERLHGPKTEVVDAAGAAVLPGFNDVHTHMNLTTFTNSAGELNIMPQWGRDSDTLYFYQVRPTQTFRRISVSGGASQEVAPWSFRNHYQVAVDGRERRAVYSFVEHGALRQSRVRDLSTGSEAPLAFALYEQRFSRDDRLIAGESRNHELLICEVSGRCRPLTAKAGHGLTALAWSGDSTRLFFLRHTSKRLWGELTSISVDGGAATVQRLVGPFEHDFQMSMDVSPRDEVVFALCREGPHELWMAKLH
jgi:hypothetical protein